MTKILAFVPNFESFFLAQRSPSVPLLPHYSCMNGTVALSEELSPNEDPFFSMISAPGGVSGISTTPTTNMIHASIPLLSSNFNGVGNFNAMSMIQAHAENGGMMGLSKQKKPEHDDFNTAEGTKKCCFCLYLCLCEEWAALGATNGENFFEMCEEDKKCYILDVKAFIDKAENENDDEGT